MNPLLAQLGLRLDKVLSDDGDSFVTVRCRDEADRRVVLKYVHSGSPDAHRRLKNETALIKHLRVRTPLRLPPHRNDGPGYLVTDYDSGTLLRPDRLDPHVVHTVARALAQFQTIRPNVRQLGVSDREHVATYYLKVLLKNLVHLWPAHVTAGEAARCQAILTTALPAICRQRVICHGDFLPTNLLYHSADDSVTFTDLEGFMCGNHPLFDVLAFCSISGLDLVDWQWQPSFLGRYLAAGGAALLDPESREYRDVYYGILIFFLVYRLNEERIALGGGSYFDGLGKRRFIMRKFGQLAMGRRTAWHDDAASDALNVRKRNLRRALAPALYREHMESMHSPLAVSA
jgi:aminoglycoside phosphotransferase (APT) family kinase protein